MATITDRVLIRIAAVNVFLVRSISLASGLHGAEGPSMMAIPINAGEVSRFSAVRAPTIRRQSKGAVTQDGQSTAVDDKAFCWLTEDHSRKNCPTGTRSVFQKSDNCFVGYQQYCCPDPSQLAGCHWEGGSRGTECSNAKCNATELEIDRAQLGGSQTGGCACKFFRLQNVSSSS